jgi:ubiquinone/menaquinone biosynthesis C-methylase UbiE
MPRNGREPDKTRTQGLYDRIADVHNLAFKLNGYRASVAKYLRSLDLTIGPASKILDAGSGTGVITLAALDAGYSPHALVSLDLSINSLKILTDELRSQRKQWSFTYPVQANILRMPFADETFDLVLTCGVLEYTPLDAGLCEAARVTRKGAPLVFLPVRPSLVGSLLEVLYSFKAHKTDEVISIASRYFKVIDHTSFPVSEPISWSKSIFLLEKK